MESDKNGEWLAHQLDQVTRRHHDLSFSKLKLAYIRIQKQAVAADPKKTQAIKRCVAQRTFMAAMDTGQSVRDCTRRFVSLTGLGFARFTTECQISIIFAQYLLEMDSRRAALRLLKQLQVRCTTSKRLRQQPRMRTCLLKIVRTLIDQSNDPIE